MRRALLATAAVLAFSFAANADPIEDRKALMKSFGGALGQLAPIAKGEKEYDSAAVMAALATLNEQVQKFDPVALFPAGTDTGDTKATMAIWEKMDDFKARAEKLKADVAEVAANPPADQAGVGAALGKIGGNCGGCHEAFRKS